jgi:hypothetical protein
MRGSVSIQKLYARRRLHLPFSARLEQSHNKLQSSKRAEPPPNSVKLFSRPVGARTLLGAGWGGVEEAFCRRSFNCIRFSHQTGQRSLGRFGVIIVKMPTIKRHPNRVHNPETRQYITLEGIASLIRQGRKSR